MEVMNNNEFSKEFKIGEQTKEFFNQNMNTLLKASAIVAFIRLIQDLAIYTIGDTSLGGGIAIITLIASSLALFFLGLSIKVIAGNWYLNKTNIELKQAYDSLNGKKLTLFISSTIKGIKIGLWSLLFVIPGIYKTFSYIFNEDFVIFNDAKATEAIKLSKELSKKNIFEIFIYYLALTILAFIPAFIIKILVPIFIMMGLGIIAPFISFVSNMIMYLVALSIMSGITMKFIDLTQKIGLELNIK
ncbi:MAG: hypothetical protein N4A54_05745 [Peptostreptococcaceae bacterium]|jgi:hypothetical protein|nr:hypothetical protein [Peptostreptococcaceae bacterium]